MALHVTGKSKASDYDKACSAVVKASNIVCLTGAGISCSAGIPDFRSKDGLYALLSRSPKASTSKEQLEDDEEIDELASDSVEEDEEDMPELLRPAKRVKLAQSVRGQDLFSANLFRHPDTTKLFHIFMSSLHAQTAASHPTPTHKFLKKLGDKNKLLRCYTQNIDELEAKAGLSYAFDYSASSRSPSASSSPASSSSGRPSKKNSSSRASVAKVVQLHGTLNSLRCGCGWAGPWSQDIFETMQLGQAAPCPDCQAFAEQRRSRGARAVRQVGHYGTLKPNVLLYDDSHPPGTTESILDYEDADLARPVDLVLVMGTSLKVPGFCNLVKDFINKARSTRPPAEVRAVLVNKTDVLTGEWKRLFDVFVQDDCDAFVSRASQVWRKTRPDDFMQQSSVLSTKLHTAPQVSVKTTKTQLTKPGALTRKPPVKDASRPRAQRSSSPEIEIVRESKPLGRRALRRQSSSLVLVPSSPKKAGSNKRKRA